jgi:hypothetical protein
MSLMIIQHSARLLQYADIMFASILIYILLPVTHEGTTTTASQGSDVARKSDTRAR